MTQKQAVSAGVQHTCPVASCLAQRSAANDFALQLNRGDAEAITARFRDVVLQKKIPELFFVKVDVLDAR